MSRLFVYGIFLDEYMRQKYGMSNPRYAVVEGYKTVLIRGDIVEAIPDHEGALTGLIVDVARNIERRGMIKDTFEELDLIEAGYDRIWIETTSGDEAWMYVSKYN